MFDDPRWGGDPRDRDDREHDRDHDDGGPHLGRGPSSRSEKSETNTRDATTSDGQSGIEIRAISIPVTSSCAISIYLEAASEKLSMTRASVSTRCAALCG